MFVCVYVCVCVCSCNWSRVHPEMCHTYSIIMIDCMIHESDAFMAEYRQACRAVKLATRKAKAGWIEGACKDIECNLKFNNTKKANETIRKLTTKRTVKSNVVDNKDGELLTESKKLAGCWAEYCSDLCTGSGVHRVLKGGF